MSRILGRLNRRGEEDGRVGVWIDIEIQVCIFEACGVLWLSVSCPGGHIGFRSVMCFLALLPCLLVPFGGWVLARAGVVPSFGSACEYLFLSSSLVHGPSLHQVEGVILPCAESALFQRSQPVLRKSPVLNLCTLLPSLGCFHTSYQPLKNMYLFFSPSLRTFFFKCPQNAIFNKTAGSMAPFME